MKGKLISHSINYKHIIALLDRANLRESMKSISRVNTFKRTSTARQTRTQREKKTSNGVMDKSFVDNIEGATGLMPAPTAESILSRASSRNNVDEIGIETTQQNILQAQADLKLPPPSPKKVNCNLKNSSNCSSTTNGNSSVKFDSVPAINLETVYEDKDTAENDV